MKMNENQDDVIELFTDSEMVSVCALIDELRLKMGILQEYLLKRETRTNETNLSAMYRFENYLPYDGNMLAYSFAKAASAGDMICNHTATVSNILIGRRRHNWKHILRSVYMKTLLIVELMKNMLQTYYLEYIIRIRIFPIKKTY